ncbi:hypothetical protein Hanom_Chr12g01151831 [Helianthus anomalus]
MCRPWEGAIEKVHLTLFLRSRGKTASILLSSDLTLALLLVRFTEYDDDDVKKLNVHRI